MYKVAPYLSAVLSERCPALIGKEFWCHFSQDVDLVACHECSSVSLGAQHEEHLRGRTGSISFCLSLW